MVILLLCLTILSIHSVYSTAPVAAIEDIEDIPVGEPVQVDGGLVVTVLKKPKKCIRQATNGDNLSVHYTGRLSDGEGAIFDTSLKKRIPFNFQLGSGQVIQGYEKGVPGMCKGETRTLLVPASMGYGERGVPGTIPGGATLHFTVELLKISDGELPPPAREKMCYERGEPKPCSEIEANKEDL